MSKATDPKEQQLRESEMRERRISELIDKQYRLYSWNDGKLQALATINGLLIATVAFLFKDGPNNLPATLALLATLTLLFGSMAICLWRIRTFPQSNRTQAPWPNLRSINGIQKFSKWEEYRDVFVGADHTRYLNDSARQLYGMAFNNRRGHRMMEIAVWVTFVGGGALVAATGFQFLLPKTPVATEMRRSFPDNPTSTKSFVTSPSTPEPPHGPKPINPKSPESAKTP